MTENSDTLRECVNCGVSFEGSPQARFHSDACRKAYARRRLVDETLPVRDVSEAPVVVHGFVVEPQAVVVRRPPFPAGPISEEQEQAIRDYGFSASEKRTRAERDAVAARIMARSRSTRLLPGFPARPDDLAPSPAQLKKLGGLWPGR
jgi:hypothetical protein